MVQKRQNTPLLEPRQEQLILALLLTRTKEEACVATGIGHTTMYRWFAKPHFMAAYRAARLAVFDEGMAVLEKTFRGAAQTLADQIDDTRWKSIKRSPILVSAAGKLLANAFKARTSIGMEEEVAGLRAIIEALEAGQQPEAWQADEPENEPPVVNNEQAEAALARAEWMGDLGMPGDAIAYSLRYNRPQSLVEEHELLDVVRKQLEWERTCDEAMRTCTQ